MKNDENIILNFHNDITIIIEQIIVGETMSIITIILIIQKSILKITC